MRVWMFPLFATLLGLTPAAHAVLTIEISKQLAALKPLAVMPFVDDNGGENLASIVRNDLSRGGLLKVVAENDLPLGLTLAGTISDETWQALPGDLLLRGSQQRGADGKYNISYELLHRDNLQPLMAERFTVGSQRWRDAGHYISDRIFETLTGEKGVFSTRIAYINVYERDGKRRYRLELSDIDGARRTRLLDSNEPIMSATWSPDGRQIAYVSFESGQSQIYTQNLQTRERKRLTDFNGINGSPSWSPDGKQLLMSLSRDGNAEIYVMDIATQALTRLTENPAIDTEPRWLSGGDSIVFTSDRGGRPQLYRMNLASGDSKRLTFEGRFNAKAAPSPNGRYVAMVHDSGDGRYRMAVRDLGTGVTDILTDSALDDSPSFAPDNRLVVYGTRQGGGRGLRIQSIDGKTQWRLPALQGEIKGPVWSPLLR
ncbi:MAG: Tol-Pal system beta propeller repeat protein TolB [Pseudomonadota bacterium]